MSEYEDDDRMACMGAATITERKATGDMEECQVCGISVRFDMTEHRFFGFAASCQKAKPEFMEAA